LRASCCCFREPRRQRKDGSLVPISLTVSPILDDAGVVIGASKIARDITAAKRQEASLRFVAEASRLAEVADASYDFVLASHVLEHVANPLRALAEWARVLRSDGLLVLVLPHRDATFDHRRPVTPLAHFQDDERRGVGEDDRTHEDEVLALHDLGRDPDAGDREHFEARIRDNVRWRSMHHHVFDTEAAIRLVDAAGFGITLLELQRPHHICIVAALGAAEANASWLAPDASWHARSPFPGDRPARGAIS